MNTGEELLVKDDETQAVEDFHPLRVVRQYARVKHVGVRDNEAPVLSCGLPYGSGGVSVVYVELELRKRKIFEHFHLILAQRLGWKKIECLRVPVL